MALSERGVHYDGRNELDPLTRRALDDIASQIHAGLNQVHATPHGTTPTPSAPSQISISNNNGFGSLRIVHNGKPGTAYIIQYSSTADFANPIEADNGIVKSWGQYLKGQTLYFRARATLYTSEPSPWTYFGSQAAPQAMTF